MLGVAAVGMVLVALSPTYPVLLATLALSGAGYLVGVSSLTGVLRRVSEDMRGRIALLGVGLRLGRPRAVT